MSPLEAAHGERSQGHQGDAHGGGGHKQPNGSQRIRGVILGHKLALKGEAECGQRSFASGMSGLEQRPCVVGRGWLGWVSLHMVTHSTASQQECWED